MVGGKRYRAAIIGTGRPRGQEGSTGAAISQFHVKGYLANDCEVVALARRAGCAHLRGLPGDAA
jgi:hypothetical protein